MYLFTFSLSLPAASLKSSNSDRDNIVKLTVILEEKGIDIKWMLPNTGPSSSTSDLFQFLTVMYYISTTPLLLPVLAASCSLHLLVEHEWRTNNKNCLLHFIYSRFTPLESPWMMGIRILFFCSVLRIHLFILFCHFRPTTRFTINRWQLRRKIKF